ncbi:MAG: hypothetical protein Q8R76_05915 [Candidatus Omnitrophota bacterium]|nr:hypothetical protein [Candidatus Omnitrophota bacterium]
MRHTEVIRPRIQPLLSSEVTPLPYVFLSESLGDVANTVVRKGKVLVEKPTLILPPNTPELNGFSADDEPSFRADIMMNFLLVRGIRFPSMKFNNITDSVGIFDGRLQKAIDYYTDLLQKEENVTAGLVMGREDVWPFSILIFVGAQMVRSADGDIRKLLEEYHKRKDE